MRENAANKNWGGAQKAPRPFVKSEGCSKESVDYTDVSENEQGGAGGCDALLRMEKERASLQNQQHQRDGEHTQKRAQQDDVCGDILSFAEQF